MNELYFRDYLTAHPETVRAYGDLKKTFGERHRHDHAYRRAKTDFICRVMNFFARDLVKKYDAY